MSETSELRERLYATTDAAVWAEEFVALFGTETIDFGLMVGWFANALATGRNAGRVDFADRWLGAL